MPKNSRPVTTGMILAAGQGSRMRELTKNTPKPLLKVKGKPLIEYRIEAYKKAGITNIVINVSLENHGQQIIDYLKDGSLHGVSIHYSIEEKALGTGGGIVKALPLLGDSFWVCGADVWTDYDFSNPNNFDTNPRGLTAGPNETDRDSAVKPRGFTNKNPLAHLILVPNPDHNTQGDFGLSDDGLLLHSPKTYTFSGAVLYHCDLFKNAPAGNFHVIDLVKKAIDEEKASAELHSGTWVDVGTPERLNNLENFHAK